jgi:hypothetical protein
MQTVPSLSIDVWLHATVLERVSVRTRLGYFRKVVRIAYVFDTGVVPHRTRPDEVDRYVRPLIFATVDYAPTIGPVRFREFRSTVDVDDSGEPIILPVSLACEGKLRSYEIVEEDRN